MTGEMIITALGYVDEKLLDDVLFEDQPAALQCTVQGSIQSTAQSMAERPRKRLGRRTLIAIIAASLVLALGVAAYASGVFTAPYGIFRTRDRQQNAYNTENIEIDDSGSNVNTGTSIDDEIYNIAHTEKYIVDGKEQDVIDIVTLVDSVYVGNLTGPVKDEAPIVLWKALQEFYEKQEPDPELSSIFREHYDLILKHNNKEISDAEYEEQTQLNETKLLEFFKEHPVKTKDPIEYMGCLFNGDGIYNKDFDTQKEAVEYIGIEGFGEQYFPFDGFKTRVTVYGDYYWEGKGETDIPERPESFSLSDIWVTIEGDRDGIEISELAQINLSEESTPGVRFWSVPDNGTKTVEQFTTSAGYNGSKITSVPGTSEKFGINANLVKNGIVYSIRITCDWADQAEAEQIFKNWTEHF